MQAQVTLNQAATLIKTTGAHVSYLLQSEPGVGKSAMLDALAASMPTHHPVYVEAQSLDLGDIQIPRLTPDSYAFVPNDMFLSDKPLLLMLDEIGKAQRGVQNAFLRTMHERKLGNYTLPAGSIVFATTNLASDGVGDMLQAHAKNRITTLRVSKPTADEWIAWGSDNDVAPEVLAWVREYPHALASYTDESETDNPYIFNPKKQQAAFVSPRSLEKASHIVKARMAFDNNSLIAALSGTVGESAARDMQAFLTVADALPRWERVVAEPTTCPVPDSPIAQTILALGAVSRLTAKTVDGWLAYLPRLQLEVQSLFAGNIMKSKNAGLCIANRKFTDWARANSFLY